MLIFETKGEYKAPLDNEVFVLGISQEFFACALLRKTSKFKPIEEPKSVFLPFILEVCMTAVITDNKKVEIQALTKFIIVQSSDMDYRAAIAFARIKNNRFDTYIQGVSVRVFTFNGS